MNGNIFMNRINEKKILVIGDVMLDHYQYGSCERISPEAPVPIVDLFKEEYLLGGAANVANNLVSLGVNVILCGIVGIDNTGNILGSLLDKKKIDNLLCTSFNRKTTVKSRIMSGAHQLLRIDSEVRHKISAEEEESIIKNVRSIVHQISLILISDYNKGLLTERLISQIIEIAKLNNILVMVDPKAPPFLKYKGANIIKPNKKEAHLETGVEIVDYDTLDAACKKIQFQSGIDTIIVTLSEDGVGLYENKKLTIVPTKAKKVFDVTGAGDTFLAAFALCIINGQEVKYACEYANFASAVVVGKIGSATTNIHEIDTIISNDKYEFI